MEYLDMSSAVQVLREEYKGWVASLSKKEIHAIRKYSYNSLDIKPNRFFERLNQMLRGEYNRNDRSILERYSETISKALGKCPIMHNIICYRGSDNSIAEGITSGTVIEVDQFVSTSVINTKALKGKYKYIIFVPKGVKGAYIEQISYFPKQREFLLDKRNKFRLINQYSDTITMEVVL